jgi:hypothetical protein
MTRLVRHEVLDCFNLAGAGVKRQATATIGLPAGGQTCIKRGRCVIVVGSVAHRNPSPVVCVRSTAGVLAAVDRTCSGSCYVVQELFSDNDPTGFQIIQCVACQATRQPKFRLNYCQRLSESL